MTNFFSQLRISQQIFAIAIVALIGFALSLGEITLEIREAEADSVRIRVAADQSALGNLLQAEALSGGSGSSRAIESAASDIRRNVDLLLNGGAIKVGEDDVDVDPVDSDLVSLFQDQVTTLDELEKAARGLTKLDKKNGSEAVGKAEKTLRDAAARFVVCAQDGLHRLQTMGEEDLVALGIWNAVIALFFSSLAIFTGIFVAKRISHSVQDAVRVIKLVGGGDLSVSLDSHSSREMSELSAAVTETVEHMSSAVLSRSVKWSEVAEQRRNDIAAQKKAKETLLVVSAAKSGDLRGSIGSKGDGVVDRIARGFDNFLATIRGSLADISKSSGTLVGSVDKMSGSTQQVERNATETSDRASSVSTASIEISRSVETVAAGIEELGASIKEISRNTTEAARVANNAVVVAEDTNTTVKKLGASSVDIGKVVSTITSIAQQTNLLALNATIEAARAGEAGKGFAVVASEVKDLARETAMATEEISVKIDAIQSDTDRAVQAIESISLIIDEISDIQNNIASAVEEQTATANEIGNSISDAAVQTSEIAENIASVADGATQTQRLAESNQERVKAMTALANDLNALLAGFRLK